MFLIIQFFLDCTTAIFEIKLLHLFVFIDIRMQLKFHKTVEIGMKDRIHNQHECL